MTAAQPNTNTPPPSGLQIDAVPDRQRVTVRARGEIDLATSPAIETRVRELYERGFDTVVLDLRDVTFMDSTGLRLLLRLQAFADAKHQRTFELADRSAPVRRLLDLTNLTSRFSTAATRTSRSPRTETRAEHGAAAARRPAGLRSHGLEPGDSATFDALARGTSELS